jgi:hypothetical protein
LGRRFPQCRNDGAVKPWPRRRPIWRVCKMSDTQCALGSGVPSALAPSQPTTYPQFLRKIGLVVSPSGGGQGLALLNPNIKIGHASRSTTPSIAAK